MAAATVRPGRKIKHVDAKMTIPKHLVIEINKLTDWKKIGAGGCGEVGPLYLLFFDMHEIAIF